MAIENTVSIDFLSTFLNSIGISDCRLPVFVFGGGGVGGGGDSHFSLGPI